MATVLKLISPRKPWIFISLGIENEDTAEMDASELFPIGSIVMIKKGNEDDSFPNNCNKVISKEVTIGNITDTLNDKNVKIDIVGVGCFKINDKPINPINPCPSSCYIHVTEITPISTVGGSKSKSRKSRKSRKNKLSNKNKSKKRNNKY
jgi:hypothetical protein